MPRFWQNQFSKYFIGAVLSGLCLSSFAQTAPLQTPAAVEYPGTIQTFEKLIEIDHAKFDKRKNLLINNGRVFEGLEKVSNLELEPDFLNSIILHSDPGYLLLASTDKCRFYESILTDLLRSAEGKITNVFITYVENGKRESAIVGKMDFLKKVVAQECPETQKNIAAFQVKTIQETLKAIPLEVPTSIEQCRNVHINWLNNPKTPFMCQIYEYVKEAKAGGGDQKDLQQRRTVAKILESKQTPIQKDYIENLCTHLADEKIFCDDFLNVSFWTKVAGGYENKIYAEDICRKILKSDSLSKDQYALCLARMRKEKDSCLYPGGVNSGLRPQPDCDQLSTALNYSSLKSDYKDCPGNSDQLIVTNMARIINHFSGNVLPPQGPCQAVSAVTTYSFNKGFDNEESWKLEACYDDKINDKEVCAKTLFGDFPGLPESYPAVVANILKNTRGAASSEVCQMVDSEEYSPLMLKYKSGCFIVYERSQCFISQCKHKILFNDRPIDFIKIKEGASLAYFPVNIREERFSQHYLLTSDFKKKGKSLINLSSMVKYFKKSPKAIVHGIACAEDILPTFFKTHSINQCTPLPFIISGLIKENDKVVFVTRTSADSLQAPRLVSWSTLYSGVKSYQKAHPMRIWTLYGLD